MHGTGILIVAGALPAIATVLLAIAMRPQDGAPCFPWTGGPASITVDG
jgi:hypothetical protein